MKPKIIISFATGLIVAAGVCGSVYFSEPSKGGRIQEATKNTSIEEMKEILTSAGYVIHTDEEWKNFAENEAEAPKEKPAKGEEKETVVYRTSLTVLEGMTSIDVGKALQQASLIDNAMEFFNDVEKRGLANDLRPGTYEIDSEMTMDEIMSTVFK